MTFHFMNVLFLIQIEMDEGPKTEFNIFYLVDTNHGKTKIGCDNNRVFANDSIPLTKWIIQL